MNIFNLFKITYNIILNLLFVSAGLVALVLVTSNLKLNLPLRLYSVVSGSMAPAIPTGSIVIVMPQSEYKQRDIISFRGENNAKVTITHRIDQIINDPDIGKLEYQTKGDANNAPDPEPVDSSRVIGKVFYSIPYIGYVTGYAQSQVGFILLVIIPATILVYTELTTIKSEIKRMWAERKTTKLPVVSTPEVNHIPAKSTQSPNAVAVREFVTSKKAPAVKSAAKSEKKSSTQKKLIKNPNPKPAIKAKKQSSVKPLSIQKKLKPIPKVSS